MAWTDERVEKLKSLWGEGMSASQIAKELGGVTRNAVIGKVHRMGLSSRGPGKPEAAAEKPEPKAAPAATAQPSPAAQKPAEPKVEEKPVAAPPVDNQLVASVENAVAEQSAVPSENAINIAEIDRQAKQLSLMDLTERTCKWPIGDPSRGEFYFCGQSAVPGKPYCAGHAAAAYQPMSSRRDRERARSAQRPALPRSA